MPVATPMAMYPQFEELPTLVSGQVSGPLTSMRTCACAAAPSSIKAMAERNRDVNDLNITASHKNGVFSYRHRRSRN